MKMNRKRPGEFARLERRVLKAETLVSKLGQKLMKDLNEAVHDLKMIDGKDAVFDGRWLVHKGGLQ